MSLNKNEIDDVVFDMFQAGNQKLKKYAIYVSECDYESDILWENIERLIKEQFCK